VVEVFDKDDLKRAQKAGAEIIQVNNRDLDSLQVDLERSLALSPRKRAGEVWISASGIKSPSHLKMLTEAGYDAALVGTGLMADGQPGEALKSLRGGNA
jgi:indole-3-glycerol phosphate synthase